MKGQATGESRALPYIYEMGKMNRFRLWVCCTGLAAWLLNEPARAQDIPALKAVTLQQWYSRPTDSVYVINFWATWCRPCIAELPYLQAVAGRYRAQKLQLLLVSLDEALSWPDQIRAFAQKREITAPLAWLDETDADYFCNLIDRRWSGAIPATLIVRPATGYRAFYEEEFTEASFETAVRKALE